MAAAKPKIEIRLPYCSHELKRCLCALRQFDRFNSFYLILNKINHCNACESVSFSRASCSISRQEDPKETLVIFPMAKIYLNGCDLLHEFLEHGKETTQEEHWNALKALVDFVNGPERRGLGKRLLQKEWSVDEALIILLHHFMSKLTVTPDDQPAYLVDNYCKKQLYQCPCCSESITGQYDDTSIGNTKVWHGRVDAIVGTNVSLAHMDVTNEMSAPASASGHGSEHDMSDDESDISPWSNVSVNSKVKKTPDQRDIHEILAQTITFSYLQHSKHPEQVPLYGNISISCIKKCVKFHFYDSVNDILLESNQVDIFDPANDLNISVVLALWFILNHSLFCTGVIQRMKDCLFNADFLKDEEVFKEIYRTELKHKCGSSRYDAEDTLQTVISEKMRTNTVEFCFQ